MGALNFLYVIDILTYESSSYESTRIRSKSSRGAILDRFDVKYSIIFLVETNAIDRDLTSRFADRILVLFQDASSEILIALIVMVPARFLHDVWIFAFVIQYPLFLYASLIIAVCSAQNRNFYRGLR
jgi:hypothetical protein